METGNLDDFARAGGFADADELRALLLRLPMDSFAKRSAYEDWAERDGTKAGLLQLAASQAE
jgi:hypothetical protein